MSAYPPSRPGVDACGPTQAEVQRGAEFDLDWWIEQQAFEVEDTSCEYLGEGSIEW